MEKDTDIKKESFKLTVGDVISYLKDFDKSKHISILPVDSETRKVFMPSGVKFFTEEPCIFVEMDKARDIDKVLEERCNDEI